MGGLSQILSDAKRRGDFHSMFISQNLPITHFSFVDDILILCGGDFMDTSVSVDLLSLFGWATIMFINIKKYSISHHNFSQMDIRHMS